MIAEQNPVGSIGDDWSILLVKVESDVDETFFVPKFRCQPEIGQFGLERTRDVS